MSEKVRMGLIVATLALIGAGLWNLQRVPASPNSTPSSVAVPSPPPAEPVPAPVQVIDLSKVIAEPPSDGSNTISGTVVDAEYEPIAGAYVFIAGYAFGSKEYEVDGDRFVKLATYTDDKGAFQIGDLDGRSLSMKYRVGARAQGFVSERTKTLWIGTDDVRLKLSEGAQLSGLLLHYTTLQPLANFALEATTKENFDGKEVVTDIDGHFTLDGLIEENYELDPLDRTFVMGPDSRVVNVQTADEEFVLYANEAAQVSGRVYDEDTNSPLAGVRVFATRMDGGNVLADPVDTDAEGKYHFARLSEGPYRLTRGTVEGYRNGDPHVASSRQRADVTFAQPLTDMDFALKKGLSISGQVVDVDGRPYVNVAIVGRGEDGRDQRNTNEKGEFELVGFPPNSTVNIYLPQNRKFFDEKKIELGASSISDLRLQAYLGAMVSGTLRTASGRMASETTLSFTEVNGASRLRMAGTDEHGNFKLGRMAAGTYHVKFNDGQNTGSESDVYLSEFTVTLGQKSEELLVILPDHLHSELTLAGHVTDEAGKPVPGVSIKIASMNTKSRNLRTKTNSDGSFTKLNIPGGRYGLQFNTKGFGKTELMDVIAGSTNLKVVLPSLGRVSGTVIDAMTQQPIKQFSLGVKKSYGDSKLTHGYQVFQNDEGAFTVGSIDSPYEPALVIRADGYAHTTVEVARVGIGETLDGIVIELKRARTLKVKVVDASGTPIKDAWVYDGRLPHGERALDREKDGTTNPRGEFEFTHLAAGPHVISAYKVGFAPTSVRTQVSPTGSEVRLVLTAGSTVYGRVTRGGVVQREGDVSVAVHRSEQGLTNFIGRTSIGDDGYYRLSGIPKGWGEVIVRIQVPDGSQVARPRIDIPASGEMRADVELEVGTATIEGYLKETETQPVEGHIAVQINGDRTSEVRNVVANEDGYFRLEELPAGQMVFRAKQPGYPAPNKTVKGELTEGENRRIDIVFAKTGKIICNFHNVPTDTIADIFLLPSDFALPVTLNNETFKEFHRAAFVTNHVIATQAILEMVDPGDYIVAVVFSEQKLVAERVSVAKGVTSEINLSF